MSKQKNIPSLRFPEFKETWKSYKLKDIAIFSKGKGISKVDINEDGVIECIRYGELYTTYSEQILNVISRTNLDKNQLVFSEANDVIIPASGETHLDIATASCVLREGIALGGDLNIIKTENNGVFLAYYFNNKKKKDIARFAQGSSVIHLYSTQLKLLRLLLPRFHEQEKIVAILTAVNERIQLLEKKRDGLERYKKGLMQQLFSKTIGLKKDDGKKYPKWKKKKWGEIGHFYYGKSAPKWSVTDDASTPCVRYGELYSTYREYIHKIVSHTNIDPDNLKFSIGGEILVPRVGEDPLDFANCSYLPLSGIAIGEMISVFTTNENGLFLVYYINSSLRKQIARLVEGGSVSNLYFRYLEDILLEIPCMEEQKKIAEFLSAINDKVSLMEQQIKKTVAYRRGLLQQMFV